MEPPADLAVRSTTNCVPGQLDMSLHVTSAALRLVRRIVADHLQLWGGRLEELSDRVLIALNELLTNVLEHTAPDPAGHRMAELLVQRVPGGLCVIVRDQDASRPQERHPSDEDERGRGLLLLRAITDGFGVSVHGPGKDVWVVVLHPDRPSKSETAPAPVHMLSSAGRGHVLPESVQPKVVS